MKTSASFLAAITALLLASASAHADLIDLQWDSSGRFEKTTSVDPGKFAEICGKLSKGQAIGWSFKAESAMNFNIHYHEGKKVEFPAKADGLITAEGKLVVGVDQHYCWMWTNKTDKASALTLTLQK
ncbi:MAG: hypothetical protein K2W93_12120 [Burkholderiaceae bacterium]|nr:hypothetical protein [Burkholderiaceae bacterium]